MAETKLLPCPFCGGEARMVCFIKSIGWTIYCPKCKVEMPSNPDKTEAIEAWNRRVPPTSEQIVAYIEETMAENREMLHEMKKKHGFE